MNGYDYVSIKLYLRNKTGIAYRMSFTNSCFKEFTKKKKKEKYITKR